MRLGRDVEGGLFEVVWSSVSPSGRNLIPRPALWSLGINSLTGFTRSGMGNGPNLRIKVEPNVWAVCRPAGSKSGPATARLVPRSRLVGSDLRAWHRLWTDYGDREVIHLGEKRAIRTCGNQGFSVSIAGHAILHDPSVARKGTGTPGRTTQRWMRFHRLFSRGIKGALRIPSLSFQYLRRPGCTAKLLYFHTICGFDPHRPYQISFISTR